MQPKQTSFAELNKLLKRITQFSKRIVIYKEAYKSINNQKLCKTVREFFIKAEHHQYVNRVRQHFINMISSAEDHHKPRYLLITFNLLASLHLCISGQYQFLKSFRSAAFYDAMNQIIKTISIEYMKEFDLGMARIIHLVDSECSCITISMIKSYQEEVVQQEEVDSQMVDAIPIASSEAPSQAHETNIQRKIMNTAVVNKIFEDSKIPILDM